MDFSLEKYLNDKIIYEAKKLSIFGEDFSPDIRPADEAFGDFQANGLMSYLGRKKENPRKWANELCELLRSEDFSVEVSGPGFINIRFSDDLLIKWLSLFNTHIAYAEEFSKKFANKTIVIDYSSPNTAKRMHVGHLRSMVIGEALQRILRFAGANVIRDNHIGDWGTQFGILLVQVKRRNYKFDEDFEKTIETLEQLYKDGSALTNNSEEELELARQELVKLQNGDEENLSIWHKINDLSYKNFDVIYKRMGVEFDWVLGESFYRDKVDEIYQKLQELGLAEVDDGALVVFHKEHARFAEQPFIIRKSDGASNYASTDLATVKYRVEKVNPHMLVYVTDHRQRDHFEQLFLTVQKWFAAENKHAPELRHVYFGTVLDENGKAIKTRDGKAIHLQNLLDEAVERAYSLINEKNPDLPDSDKRNIAEVVGLGSIKYSDLLQERTGNYRFEWDKMVNFEGNTAPYLLYAVARIYAIFRKLDLSPSNWTPTTNGMKITTNYERALAKKLVEFPTILNICIDELKPHWLCRYLFELAGKFSSFYSSDKVNVDDANIKELRLLLCKSCLSTLETGLNLLGLKTLDKM